MYYVYHIILVIIRLYVVYDKLQHNYNFIVRLIIHLI